MLRSAPSVGAAKADTITTFAVSVTFVSSGAGSCPGCTLRGYIVINTTTGAIFSENVTMTTWPFSNLITFTSRGAPFPFVEYDNLLTILQIFDNWFSPTNNMLQLVLPVRDTLVGYTGGPLCSQVVKCPNQPSVPWWSGVWTNPSGVLLGYVASGSLNAVRSVQVPRWQLRGPPGPPKRWP
jgi:hypothetical protein